MLTKFTAVALFLLEMGVCSAATVASTDFNGRIVSGNTASNLSWVHDGISDPGDLTASFPLFDTADAQEMFAVDRNIHSEGSWNVVIPLNVLAGKEINLGVVSIDAFIFNNGGNLQTINRDLDFNFSLFDSFNNLISSLDVLNIYPADGAVNPPQPRFVSVDFSGETLASADSYNLILTASGSGPGNNAGFDNLSINGEIITLTGVPISPSIILFGFGLLSIAGRYRKR